MGGYIVFKIRNSRRDKGLLLLHPEVGNYTSIKHPDFLFEEGERVDFFCPICMNFLDGEIDDNLVRVVMVDKNKEESEVFFSRIAGEHSTLNLSKKGVHVRGEHSYRYTHIRSNDQRIPDFQN